MENIPIIRLEKDATIPFGELMTEEQKQKLRNQFGDIDEHK